MFVSHQRRGRDRFLAIKLACLVAGALVGLIGMRRDSAVIIDIAIALVLAGFALRFVPQRGAAAESVSPASGAKSPDTRHRAPDTGPTPLSSRQTD